MNIARIGTAICHLPTSASHGARRSRWYVGRASRHHLTEGVVAAAAVDPSFLSLHHALKVAGVAVVKAPRKSNYYYSGKKACLPAVAPMNRPFDGRRGGLLLRYFCGAGHEVPLH